MRTLLVLLMVIVARPGAAVAAIFQHEQGGVSIWFPDNWNVDIAEGVLVATSADGDASVELESLRGAADRDAAAARCQAHLAGKVRQWRATEARHEVTINGMAGFAFGGEGVQAGVRRVVRVMVLKGPRQYLMLTWSAERGKAHQLQAIRERIVRSIKSHRGGK